MDKNELEREIEKKRKKLYKAYEEGEEEKTLKLSQEIDKLVVKHLEITSKKSKKIA